MSEMIERVARAVWEAESLRATGRPRSTTWEDAGDEWKSKYHPLARAAIEAMRLDVWSHYPEEMVLAGEGAGASGYENAADIFRAMIDVALRQETDE